MGCNVTDSFTYTVDRRARRDVVGDGVDHRDRRERSAGRRERRERANAGRDDGGGYAAGQSVDALCQRHRSGHGRHPHAQLGRHDEREGRRGHGQQRREVVVRPVELVDASSAFAGTSTTDTFTYSIKDSGGHIITCDRHCRRDGQQTIRRSRTPTACRARRRHRSPTVRRSATTPIRAAATR